MPQNDTVIIKTESDTDSAEKKKRRSDQIDPFRFNNIPKSKHKAMASKGGKNKAKNRLYNESFKQAVQWAMELPAMKGNPTVDKLRREFPQLNNRDAMAISMTAEAIKKGNVKAFEALRDTAGEAPRKQVSLDPDEGAITINIKTVE